MTRLLPPLAGAITILYFALTIGAAGCLSETAVSPATTHHHSPSHISHSSLCAWACQVNPTVAGLFLVPVKVVFAVLLLLPFVSLTAQARFVSPGSLSRAPPR